MRVHLCILFLLLGISVSAQVNIVPNPSFEYTYACPYFSGDWSACQNWNNVNMYAGPGQWGTPDYFHTCGTGGAAPPSTFAGTCSPHTGNAMMAVVVYDNPYPEYREYIATELNCNMIPGQSYTVSFWITNGQGVISPWVVKNFGIVFSLNPLSQSGWNLISATPQCEITTYVSTTSWTKYTFTVVPASSYKYMTVGVFRPDSSNGPKKDFITPGGPFSAYANYFLDDFSVVGPGSGAFTVSASDRSICAGATVTLTANGASSYSWSNGSASNSIVMTPSVTTSFTLTGTGTGNCGAGSTRTIVSVEVYPVPVADFQLKTTPCTNTIEVSGASISQAKTILWELGDGSNANSTPFSHTYQTNGVFNVSLTVINTYGCRASSSRSVAVYDFRPAATVTNSCAGQLINLHAQGGDVCSWSPGGLLSDSTSFDPVTRTTVNTEFTVHISAEMADGFKCSYINTVLAQPFPVPDAAFTYSINPCGGEVDLNDRSVGNITSWKWNLGSIKTSTLQHPFEFFASGGTQTISMFVENEYACADSALVVINTGTPPPLSYSGQSLVCQGDTVSMWAGGGLTYDWMPHEMFRDPSLQNQEIAVTQNMVYTVSISHSLSVNGNPCLFKIPIEVQVVSFSTSLIADANPKEITPGEKTLLTVKGDTDMKVTWMPNNTTTPGTGNAVMAYPGKSTTYTAQVTKGPCQLNLPVHVDVFTKGCGPGDIFVPNTFSPNGDGVNDVLFARSPKMSEVHFIVYNRWGERIFESNDVSIGWDGFYRGKSAEPGVYGWYLEIHCVTGGSTASKGNVTLIR